jgi:tetratricopeptide (TPR) repeat protein
MADKKAQVNQADAGTEVIVQKAKNFWDKFSKPIMVGGTAIILLIAGWLAYKYMYKLPGEEKAADIIFPAERLFTKMVNSNSYNKDTIAVLLSGGDLGKGKVTGLLNIINNHSGTQAANRAHYMAGACYLHMGEFDKAIKQLKAFEGRGADQIQALAYGMIGDAYAQQKKNDDALSYYKKSAEQNEADNVFTPEALFKAARFCEKTGKNKDAIAMYQKIKEKYPTSVPAFEVDKRLAYLGVIN